MTKPLSGKRYFSWLGWMDAQAGRPIIHGRAGRLAWPKWARLAVVSSQEQGERAKRSMTTRSYCRTWRKPANECSCLRCTPQAPSNPRP